MNTATRHDVSWVVVIPAKPLTTAKSRLADAAGDRRSELALAMLLDTVEATLQAHGVTAVLVVTADDVIAAATVGLGAIVVSDLPAEGLNAAFRRGVEVAVARHRGAGVALLAGDLPALRSSALETALAFAASWAGMVVVADREGGGTTMLASHSPALLRPAFGVGSFAQHVALGAVAIDLDDLETLRCDVDDAGGLEAAVRLGVGPRTTAALG